MPADFADEAQAIQDTHLRDSLAKYRRQKTNPPYSGFCLCCEEPVDLRRFCNSHCREAWEHKHRLK